MAEMIVRNAWLLVGETLAQKDILLQGDRIAGVTEPGKEKAARELDATGCSILPGLIDLHTHLTFSEDAHLISDAEVCLNGLANARAALGAGVTTVRDVGGIRGMDALLKRKAARLGVDLPRLFISGQALAPTGGHSYMRVLEVDGPGEMRQAVRQQVKRGADYIKLMLTGGLSLPGEDTEGVLFDDDEIEAAFKESRRHHRPVVVHAHGKQAMLKVAPFGPRSIEHATYLDPEVNQVLRRHGVAVVPTFHVYRHMADSYHVPEIRQGAAEILKFKTPRFLEALEQGVEWGVGTDSGRVMPPDTIINELEDLAAIGIPAAEVIRHATAGNAALMGLDDRGVIAPGKLADLLVVEGDVLADLGALRRLRWVLLSGRPVDCRTG